MVNPRNKYVLDFLGISFPFEVEGLFLTYEDETCKIEAYSRENARISSLSTETEKDLGLYDLVKITEFLTGFKLNLGRDEPALYDKNHREIIYLRLCLPSGMLQLEYKDGEETHNFDEQLSEAMRLSWEVIK